MRYELQDNVKVYHDLPLTFLHSLKLTRVYVFADKINMGGIVWISTTYCDVMALKSKDRVSKYI